MITLNFYTTILMSFTEKVIYDQELGVDFYLSSKGNASCKTLLGEKGVNMLKIQH